MARSPFLASILLLAGSRGASFPQAEESWVALHGSTVSGNDRPTALALDREGNVLVTGNAHGLYVTLKHGPAGERQWAATHDPPGFAFAGPSALRIDGQGNVIIASSDEEALSIVKYDSGGKELWVAGAAEGESIGVADMAVDGGGNVIVCGSAFTTVKYSSDGRRLWDRSFSSLSSADAVVTDGEGNIFVTGNTAVVKYDPAGRELWMNGRSGSQGSFLALDGAGNLHVACGVRGHLADEFLTIKYDPTGRQVWAAQYSGPRGIGNNVSSLVLDANGNVHVTGSSQGVGSFVDYATVKYDPEGRELWASRFTESQAHTYDTPRGMGVDSRGNVYVTGLSSGMATVKYDQDGQQIWVVREKGVEGWEYRGQIMAVDAAGNVAVTAAAERDYLIVKYDSEGNRVWGQTYTSFVGGDDAGTAIALGAKGEVIVTGLSALAGSGRSTATIQYDSDGNQEWIAARDPPLNDYSRSSVMGVDRAGNVIVAVSSERSASLVKYAPDGKELWMATHPLAGMYFRVERALLEVTGDGEAYVLLSVLDLCGPEGCPAGRFLTLKYSADGEELWSSLVDAPGLVQDTAAGLALGPRGDVHVAGASIPCIDTGFSIECDRGGDFVTVQYDPAGGTRWMARHAGSGVVAATALDVDAEGQVYVTGFAASRLVIIKYDREGNEIWSIPRSTDGVVVLVPSALLAAPDGEVYVAATDRQGSTYHLLKHAGSDGAPVWEASHPGSRPAPSLPALVSGRDGTLILAGSLEQELLVLEYDTAGTLLRESRRRSSGGGPGIARAIAVGAEGEVHVTGSDSGDYVTIKYSTVSGRARFIRGDCDGDGDAARLSDAIFLLEHAFRGGSRPECLAACDANADGKVRGVSDGVFIIQHAMGGSPPAQPFPICGTGTLLDRETGCLRNGCDG